MLTTAHLFRDYLALTRISRRPSISLLCPPYLYHSYPLSASRYVHSGLDGDQSVVYDNQRGDSTHDDTFIQVH